MMNTTDFEIENELRAVLGPGEKLVWSGRPGQGIVFQPSDVFFIPFSIIWFAFAIFWETTVVQTGAPFFFKLWGIPFILVGLYMTIGRFFTEARKRSRTYYGITNDRIIIKSGLFNQSVKSLNIKTLSDLSFTQRKNGSGTITLGPPVYRQWSFKGPDIFGHNKGPQFEAIQNVKAVYDKIVAIQRDQKYSAQFGEYSNR
jgi:hypothetical protein